MPATIARPLSAVAAFLPLLMPKCPLCAVAFCAALGIELRFVAPLTIALIVIPVVMTALRHVSIAVPLVAACGAAAAIAGRFLIDRPLLFHAGVMAIVAVTLFNAVALRRRCDRCELMS